LEAQGLPELRGGEKHLRGVEIKVKYIVAISFRVCIVIIILLMVVRKTERKPDERASQEVGLQAVRI
jgi:hypothetical protein